MFVLSLQANNYNCKLCRFGVEVIYDQFENGESQAKLFSQFEKMCEHTPWKENCNEFAVTEYIKVIKQVHQALPAEQLCTLMNVCAYKLPPINGLCDVCLIGLGFVEDIISQDIGLEIMDYALEYMCYMFPAGKWRTDCKNFVDSQYEQLIIWAHEKYPAEVMCASVCKFA
ncbi:Saposin [Hexamita inflata]|uniref:Putative n=1 Tax=Hexamita inflata TaxID=28002 RepID=A0AA86P362_9EUKA|nr:Saposin [Hexamita inflata]